MTQVVEGLPRKHKVPKKVGMLQCMKYVNVLKAFCEGSMEMIGV
jgi:hypothetical protein